MAEIKVDEANVITTLNNVKLDTTVPNADVVTTQSITAKVEPDNYVIASQGYSAGVPGWVSSKVSEIIQDSIGNGTTLADALDKIKTDLMDQIQLGVNQAISEVENAYVSKSELTTTLASEIDASRASILDSVQTYADSTQSVTSEVNALKASFGNDISSEAINAFIGNIALTKATSKEAFTQTVNTLTASYNDLNAQLISTDTVVAGQFKEWDHSSTPKPGMFKIEDGSYWNYIGGTLGENNDGWIRTDKSALDTAEAINLQLTDSINLLKTQVDGLQETIAGTSSVILTNGNPDELAEPYKTWLNTDTANGDTKTRLAHTSDVYIKYHLDYKGTKVYDTAYRFVHTTIGNDTDSEGFTWVAITNEATIDAMNQALQAKDMSDDKRRVFISTPYPPYDAGDLWVYTDSITNSKSIKHAITSRAYNDTYTETDWTLASTDDSYAIQEITRLDTTLASDYLKEADIDGKISIEEQARENAILAEQTARAQEIQNRIDKEALLDGRITNEESARIQASADLETAYKNYSTVVTKAMADGVLTQEEQDLIAASKDAVDAAKLRLKNIESNVSELVTRTDEIDTTLSNQALNNANLDGKISTEESTRIQAILDEQNARAADIVTRIDAENVLDGKIITEEAARKQAALDLEAAYKEYSKIITLSIADGILTDAEKAKIADAQTAVDAVKQRLLNIENKAEITTQTIKKYETASGMIHNGFTDGEITIFTSIGEPSNPNFYDVWRIDKNYVPVDQWTSSDPEVAYATDNGYLYKYYDGSEWQFATANQVALMKTALKLTNVKDLADGKVRLFNNEPTVPYNIGDLWINSSVMYRSTINRTDSFYIDDWVNVEALDQTARDSAATAHNYISNILTDINSIKKQVDKSATAYFFDYVPTNDGTPLNVEPYATWANIDTTNGNTSERSVHVGDTFAYYILDTNGAKVYNSSFKFMLNTESSTTDSDGFTWIAITNDIAAQALAIALNAKDTADHKRRVFVETPYPPYDKGDMWLDGTDIKRSNTNLNSTGTYLESHWVPASAYVTNTDVKKVVEDKSTIITNEYKLYVDDNLSYNVKIFSSAGNMFRNGIISTELNTKVYKGQEDITSTFPLSRFSWTRNGTNTDSDKQWNLAHESIGPTITITDQDVYGKAVFNCIVVI